MTEARQRVAQVALPVPMPQCFDYLPPKGHELPPIGSRVLVGFGPRRLVGLVLGHTDSTTEPRKLKPIDQVLDEALIDEDLLVMHDWAARYYAYPPGECTQLLLPPALRRVEPFNPPGPNGFQLTDAGQQAEPKRSPAQRRVLDALAEGPQLRSALVSLGIQSSTLKRLVDKAWIEAVSIEPSLIAREGPVLSEEQRQAVGTVCQAYGGYQAFLLAGVTGSGKTEVYLQCAIECMARDEQVLLMIPEIGLTPQLIERVMNRLGTAAFVYHSNLSESERLACWQAARCGKAKVVIGTRSSIFLPFKHLGLIVVDEEHDASYKQIDGARYHGRDLAVWRARYRQCPIVLGSATPSLESINNTEHGRYQLLKLTARATDAPLPQWRIIDQRNQQEGLSDTLVGLIKKHLASDGQVLIYRNRRGYAPVLMCQACGWQADCHRCSAHMTVHQNQKKLQCHHCGHQSALPHRCPACEDPKLQALGAGTERLETTLAGLFPDYPVHRVDRDVMTGRYDFERLLEEVKNGGPCILVGTQMLAKGHHLPKVTLAVVLDADQALFSGDFRAPERLGQVIYQVAGRAGRVVNDQCLPGEFVLQTRHPEHALLDRLRHGHYLGFATQLLAERREAGLPPTEGLVLLRAEAHQPEAAWAFLQDAQKLWQQAGLQAQGPIASIMPKRGGYWRFQLWLQADTRATLIDTVARTWTALYGLPSAKKVRWHMDVDPTEL